MLLLNTDDVSEELLKDVFTIARSHCNALPFDWSGFFKNRIIASIFLEPSTRTRLSFEAAATYLGSKYISVSDGKASSVAKGETIYDTLMTVAQYAKTIVIRCSEDLNATLSLHQKKKLEESTRLVINAGDGAHHPTQAVLDAFTINEKLGKINGLNIGVVGDLRFSRTVNSLVSLMKRFDNTFYVLDSLGFAQDLSFLPKWKDEVKICGYSEFEEYLPKLDVLYLNRLQRERHGYAVGQSLFQLDERHLNKLPKHAIVMNPGPRREEMPESLDHSEKIVYFQQTQNGLWCRMALLHILMLKNGPKNPYI